MKLEYLLELSNIYHCGVSCQFPETRRMEFGLLSQCNYGFWTRRRDTSTDNGALVLLSDRL